MIGPSWPVRLWQAEGLLCPFPRLTGEVRRRWAALCRRSRGSRGMRTMARVAAAFQRAAPAAQLSMSVAAPLMGPGLLRSVCICTKAGKSAYSAEKHKGRIRCVNDQSGVLA